MLTRITPGEQFGMIVEMSALRRPQARLVLADPGYRIKEFLFIAMPLLIVTSIALGLLQYYGVTEIFERLVAPITVTLLGLPEYASTALLFGIFRKELAFETLAVLSGTADLGSVMTAGQTLYLCNCQCSFCSLHFHDCCAVPPDWGHASLS